MEIILYKYADEWVPGGSTLLRKKHEPLAIRKVINGLEYAFFVNGKLRKGKDYYAEVKISDTCGVDVFYMPEEKEGLAIGLGFEYGTLKKAVEKIGVETPEKVKLLHGRCRWFWL